jgi:hypothetical protein
MKGHCYCFTDGLTAKPVTSADVDLLWPVDHETAQPGGARGPRRGRPLVGCIRCTRASGRGIRARSPWPGHEQGGSALSCCSASAVFVRQNAFETPPSPSSLSLHTWFARLPQLQTKPRTAMPPHPALLARVLYSYPLSPIPRRRTSYNCISSASARAAMLIIRIPQLPTPHERFA